MKIASWNVNSLRARLPQLLDWLRAVRPDVVCLQETKVVDEEFPAFELMVAGYTAVYAGEKTYNGVAILAREELSEVRVGLPGDGADSPKRLIAARVGGVDVVCVYVPNGAPVGSERYAAKLEWMERLRRFVEAGFEPGARLAVCGDFNVAPEDRDVHDPEAYRQEIMFTSPERGALKAILDRGLSDTLRLHRSEGGLYSWWDYRTPAFRRNEGWRIDLILANAPLARSCTGAWIDTAPRGRERPSDHAPVLAAFGHEAGPLD